VIAALLLATAAAETPICTDRPTKANATCTVSAGKWQLESSAVGWSRTDVDGARVEILALGASTVKVGIGERTDVQVAITPYVEVIAKTAGVRDRQSGFGDTTIRVKHRLTGDEAAAQVGVIPFVKVPTAKRGLGNRTLEGGLAVPISFALAKNVTATFGPEVDVLADGDGQGHHVGIVNLVNIAMVAAPRLTLIGEVWSNVNFDPDGTVRQASVDAAMAYAVHDRLQLDAGVNLGLTRATPDVEAYVGISTRF
jgi:hypothetical protein